MRLLTIAFSLLALNGDTSVLQSFERGQVNWTNLTITAPGNGIPDLKAPNVAAARRAAERVAKLSGVAGVLYTLRQVRLTSDETVDARLRNAADTQAQLDGWVKDYKLLDTKYYSDGGVDVVLQVPLWGKLLVFMLPQAGTVRPASAKNGHTGVVVDAKGLQLEPALAPRLLRETGEVAYGAAFVQHEALQQRGIAAYAPSLDAALRLERVGDKPLVLRALRLWGDNRVDLVLKDDDAARLATLGGALAEGRVVLVQ